MALIKWTLDLDKAKKYHGGKVSGTADVAVYSESTNEYEEESSANRVSHQVSETRQS